ncbi:MAG: MBL fold metallo-hydrolase [Caldithrix sp.]|nr:MBL fold metallo-hydrolase [Caldithrix sp.]
MPMTNMEEMHKKFRQSQDNGFTVFEDGVFTVLFNENKNQSRMLNLPVNFVYVHSSDGRFLIDLGLGNFPHKMFKRKSRTPFYTHPQHLLGKGIRPDSIDGIILSHMHIDHIGGYGNHDSEQFIPFYPNVPCFVQKKEWDFRAEKYDKAEQAYKNTMDGLQKNIRLIDGNREIANGIDVVLTGGHTPGHQIIFFSTNKRKVCYAGDIISTENQAVDGRALPHDYDRTTSKKVRDALIDQARSQNWIFIYSHAAHIKAGRLESTEKNE